ncbi:hypothetical protein [Paraburkholderia diazotrophica]|uniref:hypothetical protein n=1 Tax=Paraburkholderia diazotrophica TaxID=667676 RepID=UPI0015A6448D|nr:hypothetical protein [Paraburkholderia diazotrophica]
MTTSGVAGDWKVTSKATPPVKMQGLRSGCSDAETALFSMEVLDLAVRTIPVRTDSKVPLIRQPLEGFISFYIML